MRTRAPLGYFFKMSIISLVVGVCFFVGCLTYWCVAGIGKATVSFGMMWLFGWLANSLAFLVLHRMDSAGYDVGIWRWKRDFKLYSEYWRIAPDKGCRDSRLLPLLPASWPPPCAYFRCQPLPDIRCLADAGLESNCLLTTTIRYNLSVQTKHPLVEQIEKLFLPDLERLVLQMRERFPSLSFNVWQSPVGTLTEYKGYDLGVECLFPVTAENAPDNVALMIDVCFLNSRPRFNAGVGWGHPSGHSEAKFRDNCLTNAEWPEAKPAAVEELREFFPTLVRGVRVCSQARCGL